jgi:hypothetical protein
VSGIILIIYFLTNCIMGSTISAHVKNQTNNKKRKALGLPAISMVYRRELQADAVDHRAELEAYAEDNRRRLPVLPMPDLSKLVAEERKRGIRYSR